MNVIMGFYKNSALNKGVPCNFLSLGYLELINECTCGLVTITKTLPWDARHFLSGCSLLVLGQALDNWSILNTNQNLCI